MSKPFTITAGHGGSDPGAVYQGVAERDLMAAPSFWTVGQTIDHIRRHSDDLPELFFDVYVIDPSSEDEMRRAKEHSDRMVLRALAMEGTCTGEHGVGYGKIEFLAAVLPEAVPVMRAVKQALDPDNIMNPGKLFRMN